MGTHRDDVEMLKHSFKDGASMMRDALSMPRDPDLANYQKMSEQDFTDMMKEMGSGPVIDYIKKMEMKAGGVKEKKNG